MGWFRRSAGRHSYGVPVVAAPAPAVPAAPAVAVIALAPPAHPPARSPMPATPSSPLSAIPPPPPFRMPTRLPDDRTTGQIGGKVAEVLWTHYASQGLTGTPLTPSAAQIATSPSYDDAYADTLFELAPPVVVAAPQPTFTPVLHRLGAPVVAPVRFQVFERLRPLPPAAAVVTSVVTTTASVQLVHDEPAPMPVEPEAEAAAVTVPPVPEKRFHVVQLGFLDGSTMDLAGDHPASKALRAAAAALTLRE